jgi:hypothetical protein
MTPAASIAIDLTPSTGTPVYKRFNRECGVGVPPRLVEGARHPLGVSAPVLFGEAFAKAEERAGISRMPGEILPEHALGACRG